MMREVKFTVVNSNPYLPIEVIEALKCARSKEWVFKVKNNGEVDNSSKKTHKQG